ncbi:hypothetical protein AB1J88_01035 [Pseudomonas sp. S8]|uniref:hypothetical protein n=1 Tax=Pseudomonas sp. S8 TaxID=211136 RepID=UPI003D2CFB1E
MDAKKAQILIGGFPTYNLKSILGYVSGSISWIAGVAISVGVVLFGINLFSSKKPAPNGIHRETTFLYRDMLAGISGHQHRFFTFQST